jgi:hypothetical protein
MAMAKQSTPVEWIESRVQGEVSGQIAVGTFILQIGSVHGGIVNVAVAGEQPRPKARSVPLSISASIIGPVSGQVAVGKDITQTQRIGAAAKVTEAEEAPKPIQLAFLSYAREDAEFVLHLAKDLRAGGADVWIDRLDIRPGQRWDRAVEDALAKCPQLLVILSPAAVESTNVMDEVSLALEEGKTVLPVIHCQCKIPFRLRRLQYVDLTLNYKAGLGQLLETLGTREIQSRNDPVVVAASGTANAMKLRPRPFPAILDRTEESAAAIRALESGESVEVFGEPGIGKTVLLRHLAHTIDSKHFREGIIYREIHDDPPGDVLQVLWGDFFECDTPFKPADSQLRRDLQTKQALIIFDAVELSRAEVEQVMNVAAACTFLLGSPKRHLWGSEAYATHLAGLPAKDAKTLVERELGRPLTEDEALAVETVTIALKGNPLRVLQQVGMAQLNDRSLTSIAQDLQSGASPEKLTARITVPLSDVQHGMLSALAIFSGAPVQATTLGELLQIDDAETILEELEERHLVRTIHGRYTLAGEVAPFMPKEMETTEERKRVVAYFSDWIERHQREVKTVLETLPVLMRCLRWSVEFGMVAEVMRITKSLEFTLILSGRWESWANALRLAAQSAIAAGDKAALGWIRHQNGTKALCDGNLLEARESLEQALQIREALSDRAGADVTRHNLNLVAPLTIPLWKLWKLPTTIAAITCALIAAMVFASKIPNLWHPSRTRALTATMTPAAIPSPTATTIAALPAPLPNIPPPTGAAATGHVPSGISPTAFSPIAAPTVPEATGISPSFLPIIAPTAVPEATGLPLIPSAVFEQQAIPHSAPSETSRARKHKGAHAQAGGASSGGPPAESAKKKREKGSPSPGPHLGASPAGTRTATPAPRPPLQIGIGRGAPPPP